MQTGPMRRLDDYMGEALSLYYNAKDPFGKDGDFTTAPEISQLFGEMIGIWAAQQWLAMGSPSCFNLIELGPGRGTLMADLLRATQHIPGMHDAMTVHMVETSALLISAQKKSLDRYQVIWHDHLSDIRNDIPAIIIANEFFDALPVRQFQYMSEAWHEHYINNGQSVWRAVDNPPIKATLPTPNEGDVYEYSKTQADYAKLIATHHGAALIIDYGYKNSAYGDSLQALYNHQPCQPTDHFGECDLTTHVDFQWLNTFFENGILMTQENFLIQNGIDIRYRSLNTPELKSGYDRLLAPNQMGHLFKVLDIKLTQTP